MLEEGAQPSDSQNVHALCDLATVRAFLTGPGAMAFFDIPWLPVYILVVFLFHPVLGAVALIGTLVLLALARFNEKLDGAEVTAWPREALAAHVGYLPQDVELFAATVSQNIARMGEVNDAAVIEAAQRAGAHEMILRLPQGYDTPISAAGSALSGGQRQRIGLARALYGNPRLIVLDEPNANLDAEGEMALLSALADIKQAGATLIIITHRPSLLGQIDKMLVLREGRIELFGSRAQVMSRVVPGIAAVKPSDTLRVHSQA